MHTLSFPWESEREALPPVGLYEWGSGPWPVRNARSGSSERSANCAGGSRLRSQPPSWRPDINAASLFGGVTYDVGLPACIGTNCRGAGQACKRQGSIGVSRRIPPACVGKPCRREDPQTPGHVPWEDTGPQEPARQRWLTALESVADARQRWPERGRSHGRIGKGRTPAPNSEEDGA